MLVYAKRVAKIQLATPLHPRHTYLNHAADPVVHYVQHNVLRHLPFESPYIILPPVPPPFRHFRFVLQKIRKKQVPRLSLVVGLSTKVPGIAESEPGPVLFCIDSSPYLSTAIHNFALVCVIINFVSSSVFS